MKPISEQTGPELAAWAAKHIIPEQDYQFDDGTCIIHGDADIFMPHTDWNDAIRVARAVEAKCYIVHEYIGNIAIEESPESLLRYVCREWGDLEQQDQEYAEAERDAQENPDLPTS